MSETTRRKGCRCLLAAGLALVAFAGPLPAGAPVIPDEVADNVRRRAELKYCAGIVIGLVSSGGVRYLSHGTTALAGGETPDEHTVFEIGSITKVFTSLVLARMVEKGELSLEDPLADHLPQDVRVPERGGPIRLVDLATHRSGLPRMPDNFDPRDPANPFADYTVELAYAFLSNHELRRKVGERYEYSNYGAGILGHALALRRGTSYERLVRKMITSKLGMRDTAVTLTPGMRRRLARPHASTAEVKNWDLPALAGAGALRSTAADMVRFLEANMGLTETKLASALRAIREPRHETGMGTMRVALGWHTRGRGEREIIWHNGQTGGYHAFIGFVAGGDRGVVVLTNTSTDVDDIGFHLLGADVPLFQPKPPRKLRLFKKD